jgi:hypothetical protein
LKESFAALSRAMVVEDPCRRETFGSGDGYLGASFLAIQGVACRE